MGSLALLPVDVETAVDLSHLVVPSGLSTIEFVVPEGGQSLSESISDEDARIVSVAIRDLEVIPRPWVFVLPEMTSQCSVNFGDTMELVGYDIAREPLKPMDNLEVRLYWRALANSPKDYTVSVQLMGEDGTVAQLDRQPLHGLYPTSRWRVGEVLVDDVAFDLLPNAGPGRYRLIALVYDLATMERLPLVAGIEPDWAELTSVEVVSP